MCGFKAAAFLYMAKIMDSEKQGPQPPGLPQSHVIHRTKSIIGSVGQLGSYKCT